jgi:hypothetical protein
MRGREGSTASGLAVVAILISAIGLLAATLPGSGDGRVAAPAPPVSGAGAADGPSGHASTWIAGSATVRPVGGRQLAVVLRVSAPSASSSPTPPGSSASTGAQLRPEVRVVLAGLDASARVAACTWHPLPRRPLYSCGAVLPARQARAVGVSGLGADGSAVTAATIEVRDTRGGWSPVPGGASTVRIGQTARP